MTYELPETGSFPRLIGRTSLASLDSLVVVPFVRGSMTSFADSDSLRPLTQRMISANPSWAYTGGDPRFTFTLYTQAQASWLMTEIMRSLQQGGDYA